MKKQTKGFISGIIATALVLALSGTALAVAKTATLNYGDMKITINGSAVVPTDADGNKVQPFAIDGITYLPVRSIANLLDMDLSWDSATNTVVLSDKNALESGTVLYSDNYVSVEFVKCVNESTSYSTKYDAVFNITNKTKYELTVQPGAISFDGISYTLSGSPEVAPMSTGEVAFYTYSDTLPVSGIAKTSGTISVIDFTRKLFTGSSYDAKWVDVTGK